MGVRTHCLLYVYTADKELIQQIHLDEMADGFVYHLLDDGGATFDPDQLGSFSTQEKAHLKLYFDKQSASAYEGDATPRPNLHLATDIRPTWEKLENSVGQKYLDATRAYRMKEETDMAPHTFRSLTDTNEANVACIRRIISLLEVAEKGDCWVEITVADY